MTTELVEGMSAPSFSLPTNGGGTINLAELRGQNVVVYFYPKDNTPGCTTEALDFTSLKDQFANANTAIIGVSADSVRKHDNFITKHDLGITLASDENTEVCNAYGVWVEKKMYGKTFMGIERATFLMDSSGKLTRIWRKVKVKGHAEEVLTAAKTLS
ncbi:thioredoxin-dependent thiol peroxidase [Cohaesibacter gelatinilyticus]|uniref:thioredoxin-dependent peroxiredoxin n=1 Tax=Cohaesibacter gelatinilyticus TaxID=372072 RepID=A0A285NES5_9HYPH|nr:thioredoxin-dependent thiol peroxidase [Cohaesibacter gelatinilyticus]SNZ08002.1 peroxiredoxin Q/BCP [Cohaesibacter gelatinilyticus]HAT87833.1 thioredoxin-dependent thiol peroxidase [Hyphomicrobiales bacterium]